MEDNTYETIAMDVLFQSLISRHKRNESPIRTLLNVERRETTLWFMNVSSTPCNMQFGFFQPGLFLRVRGAGILNGVNINRLNEKELIGDVSVLGQETIFLPPGMTTDTDGAFLLKWIPKKQLRNGKTFTFVLTVNGIKHSTEAIICFDGDPLKR